MIKELKKTLTKEQLLYLKRIPTLRRGIEAAFVLGPGIIEEFYAFGTDPQLIPRHILEFEYRTQENASIGIFDDCIWRPNVTSLSSITNPVTAASQGLVVSSHYICIPINGFKTMASKNDQYQQVSGGLARRRLQSNFDNVRWGQVLKSLEESPNNKCTFHVYLSTITGVRKRFSSIPDLVNAGLLIRTVNVMLLDLTLTASAEMRDPYTGLYGPCKSFRITDKTQATALFELKSHRPTASELRKSKEVGDMMGYNVGINRMLDAIAKSGGLASKRKSPTRSDIVSNMDLSGAGPSRTVSGAEKFLTMMLLHTFRYLHQSRNQNMLISHIPAMQIAFSNLKMAVVSGGEKGAEFTRWKFDYPSAYSILSYSSTPVVEKLLGSGAIVEQSSSAGIAPLSLECTLKNNLDYCFNFEA